MKISWLLAVSATQLPLGQSLSHQEYEEKQWQECSRFSILSPQQTECNEDRELGTTHADYHCKFGAWGPSWVGPVSNCKKCGRVINHLHLSLSANTSSFSLGQKSVLAFHQNAKRYWLKFIPSKYVSRTLVQQGPYTTWCKLVSVQVVVSAKDPQQGQNSRK